jgi:putative ABC transport system substrate-binding protein
MRRHRTLSVFTASLILLAGQADGQQLVHRIGVLQNEEITEIKEAWEDGLRELGYFPGRNLQIEYRYSHARSERIPELVSELVAFGPEVIVAGSPPNATAVHAAAPAIPLVFVNVADPVTLGLVESLAHPGDNVTGFATLAPEVLPGSCSSFSRTSFRRRHGSPCWSIPQTNFTAESRLNFLRSPEY